MVAPSITSTGPVPMMSTFSLRSFAQRADVVERDPLPVVAFPRVVDVEAVGAGVERDDLQILVPVVVLPPARRRPVSTGERVRRESSTRFQHVGDVGLGHASMLPQHREPYHRPLPP